MALGEWLGGLGDRFTGNISAAGPQGLASLGAAIAGAPRNQWGTGLAQGLAGLSQAAQANKKKASLAEALKGAMGNLTPQQQAFLSAVDPSQASEIIGSQLFAKPGEHWQDVDLDKDGKVDFQVNPTTNERRASPMSYQDRMTSAIGAQTIPGLGTIDKYGNPIAAPAGATPQPPGQPVAAPAPPATTTTAANPFAAAEPTGAPAGPVVSAPPNGRGAPQSKLTVPIPAQQYGAFGLPAAKSGSQWVRDFDPTSRQWSQPRRVDIPGAIPEDRQVQGDIAGRLGLAKSFLGEADATRARIEAGEAKGIMNQSQMALNMGGPGEIWRKESDGADVMQRLMTGAGMPKQEAATYSARFEPSIGDSRETMLSKHDQLVKNLKNIYEVAATGRATADDIRKVMDLATTGPQSQFTGKPKEFHYDAQGNRQ